MDAKTLAIAKELEKGIERMESALKSYKGREEDSTTHFDFNSRGFSYYLPRWINEKLMKVVEQELENSKQALEKL